MVKSRPIPNDTIPNISQVLYRNIPHRLPRRRPRNLRQTPTTPRLQQPLPPPQIEVGKPLTSFKPTEIHVTTELATMTLPNMRDVFFPIDESDESNGLPCTRPSTGGYDQYSATIGSTPPMNPTFQAPPAPPKGSVTVQQRIDNNRAANDANAAAFGYTKVALLFFISLHVTWVCTSNSSVS